MEVASILNLQILYFYVTCYFSRLIQDYLTVFIGKCRLCPQSYTCKLLAKHISCRHLSWLLYADFKKTLGCRELKPPLCLFRDPLSKRQKLFSHHKHQPRQLLPIQICQGFLLLLENAQLPASPVHLMDYVFMMPQQPQENISSSNSNNRGNPQTVNTVDKSAPPSEPGRYGEWDAEQ